MIMQKDRAFVERIEWQPTDPQTNGPQLLYGRRYHTDRNTLTKIGEPTPNPIASECLTPDRDLESPARRAARLTAYLGRVEGLTVYFFSVRVFTISAICRSDSASSALTSF